MAKKKKKKKKKKKVARKKLRRKKAGWATGSKALIFDRNEIKIADI